MSIQTLVLKNLIENDDFTRKVIPFLKKEYFEGAHKFVFQEIVKFVNKYNALPTHEALQVEFDNEGYSDDLYAECAGVLTDIANEAQKPDDQWLIDNTEKWCQDRAIHNAVMKSIEIIEGKDQKNGRGVLPELLSEALAVSFDTSVGHDYLENFEERYAFYQNTEERIPFDLEMMNEITKNGITKKSLNVFLASTGVGKSLVMCHMAGAHLQEGKNILYITMEMSEEKISERIDANLFNVTIDQVENLSKDVFTKKIDKIKAKTRGKLIVKEYPTGAAHSGHFRALIKELKLKKNFTPDIIYVDYLNICASSRVAGGGQQNMYGFAKAIAEELRGLAIEFNLPVVTATQSNRDGANNSDVDLTNTSESFGVPATADFMAALISTEELENLGQIMVKQLKNRYNDVNKNKRFVLGIDRSKMRLYDVDQSGQSGLSNSDVPIADYSQANDSLGKKEKFGGFKV